MFDGLAPLVGGPAAAVLTVELYRRTFGKNPPLEVELDEDEES